MVDAYYADTRYVDVEQARVYFNTRQPVPLYTIGRFLTTVGKEVDKAYGDGFVVELEAIEQGSIGFIFRKFREWTSDEDDRRDRDERLLKLAEAAEERDQRLLQLAERVDRRDERALELAERADRRDDRILLATVVGIALAAPSAAKAALELLEYGEGTEVVIQQNDTRPELIPAREFDDIIQDDRSARHAKRAQAIALEDRRMLTYLEENAFFDLAGKIVPKNKDFFRTVKGNQYRILNRPETSPVGTLIVIHARAERDQNDQIGLNILDVRPLDDE